MHGAIAHLIASYGYGILFFLVAAESLGIPLPGETALVTASAFAANGDLDIRWVFLVGVVAAIVGDNAGYWLGRTGGLQLVEKYGHRVGLNEAKLAKVRGFYETHGARTVLIGRFIAILRSWAAVLAGVMKMSYPRFVVFNAAGCILWTSVFTTVGYLFGKNLPLVERYIRQVGMGLGIAVVIAIAIFFIRRRSRLPNPPPPAP